MGLNKSEQFINDASGPLRNLKGADIIQLTPTEFAIDITNPEKWNKNITQLKKEFWGLIKEAYNREDNELERQLQLTFENTKNVYALTNSEQIIGFCSIEQHNLDPKVGIVRDIIIEKKERGKGLSKDLYSLMFSQHKYDAFIGVSVNFAAIKTRIATSKQYGYSNYYGSMGSGNPEIERLRKLNEEYMLSKRLFANEKLPKGNDGFILLETDVLPPLTKEDIAQLDPLSDLYNQAQEILELQKNYYKNDQPFATVAGHLINIREKNNFLSFNFKINSSIIYYNEKNSRF